MGGLHRFVSDEVELENVVMAKVVIVNIGERGTYHSVEVMVYQYDKLFGYGMTSIPTINYIFIFCCIFLEYCNI